MRFMKVSLMNGHRLHPPRLSARGMAPGRVALAVAVLAVSLVARPCTAQAVSDAGLTSLRDAFAAAYSAGDSHALAPLFVSDAVRMPYDGPAQEGRDAILAYYRTDFAKRSFDPALKLIPREVERSDTMAVERGAYEEVGRPKDGGATWVERGKYVALMVRGERGAWRYRWWIFNADGPPQPR